ncbi:MAG: P1 family peptidase [Bacillota bacterium]
MGGLGLGEIPRGSITDVPGIIVGHASDLEALTGCTVVICEKGAVAAADVRGGAPGTRETDLLDPSNLVEQVHAVVLTGGSAFGLEAACGVMQYLEERGIGFEAGVARVPIVPAAVIFDLAVGSPKRRPDKAMGYLACVAASSRECGRGNIGAGTGATVGKLKGMKFAMKGGLGTSSRRVGQLVVGAIVVVNAFGDVVNPYTGQILAGTLNDSLEGFADTASLMVQTQLGYAGGFTTNTTVVVVATNARLTKAQAKRVCYMGHDGLALAVRPVHTLFDGDTVFTMATCEVNADPNVVGTLACEVVADAIVDAVIAAEGVAGLKAYRDLLGQTQYGR